MLVAESTIEVTIIDEMTQALRALFTQSNHTGQIVRVEVACPPLDGLHWLTFQAHPEKWYWGDRGGAWNVAGIGSADLVTGPEPHPQLFAQLQRRLSAEYPRLRYYGGLRFNGLATIDPCWQAYGAYRFHIPQFEILREGEQHFFACNLQIDPEQTRAEQLEIALANLAQIKWEADGSAESIVPHPLTRLDLPERVDWDAKIDTLLDLFERGELEKMVLARKVIVSASEKLDPAWVLMRLRAVTHNAYHFLVQIDENHAFIGASPERLYQRNGKILTSEALAGTRKRGNTPEEDEQFAQELLNSPKERHEQGLVLKTVSADFDQLCTAIEKAEQPSLLKLAQLQHLYNQIQGQLRPNVTDDEIIAQLHPTPAMGGYPRREAIAQIEQLEPFDRGWYTGPIGWMGKDSAEFGVAIRCALIERDQLSAFSGAGIVEGSTAEEEWNEIENKLLHFRRALMG